MKSYRIKLKNGIDLLISATGIEDGGPILFYNDDEIVLYLATDEYIYIQLLGENKIA